MDHLRALEFEQIAPGLRQQLQPTVDRLGYFGAFFQFMAHTPDVLASFMAYSGALKTTLPGNINELIALTVCSRMDFAYERIQHERLALTLGFDRAWIHGLVGGPERAPYDATETQVRAVTALIVDGHAAEARRGLDALAALAGEPFAMAVLVQISRFMSICTIGKVLDLALPVPSIFEAPAGR